MPYDDAALRGFLQLLDDRLRPLADPVEVQHVAATLLGEHVHASRVGYAEDVGDGESVVVVRSYVDGVAALEGRYRYDDYGPELLRAFRAGRTVVRPDIASDPGLTPAERAAHASLQIASSVNVPLLKDGRLVAVLFLHHRAPRAWSRGELRMLDAVAERTWAAVQRARAEEAQRRSEAMYRGLFESMEEGCAVLELVRAPDGRVVDLRYLQCNPAFGRLTGLAVVPGQSAGTLVEGLEPGWVARVGDVVGQGAPLRLEAPVGPAERWFEIKASRIGRAGDEQVSVLLRDVTEQRRADAALRANEARLRLIADVVPDMLWSSDPASRVDWCNERMLAHVGSGPGLGVDWAVLVHPEDLPAVREQWERSLATTTPFASEHRVRGRADDYRWYLVRAAPMRGPDGAVTGWIGAMTDVHELRAARELLEARVRERTRELEQASELRRQLHARLDTLQDEERRRIARELHDALGQQLTAVMLAVSQAAAADLPAAARAALDRVMSLMKAVDTDLDRLVFQLRPTGLDDGGLAEGVAAHADTWSQLSGVPVDLLARGLDRRRLPRAVESAVFRVVQEALTNVAKHARARQVAISIEVVRGALRVAVEDDGRGFDVEGEDSPTSWGLLGMKERVEALGGRFVIESAPGQGATVLVHVPLAAGDD